MAAVALMYLPKIGRCECSCQEIQRLAEEFVLGAEDADVGLRGTEVEEGAGEFFGEFDIGTRDLDWAEGHPAAGALSGLGVEGLVAGGIEVGDVVCAEGLSAGGGV